MVRIKRNLNVGDLLIEHRYTQRELAKKLDKSVGYINARCTEEEPWTTDDMIIISDLFGLSDDEMLQYFVHPSKKIKNRRKK